jgi:predicted DNA-binding transcriptional regulator AlpA
VSDQPGSIKAMARCGGCGHFASVHHGGGGGRPGGSSCAAPDCDCPKFLEGSDARVPLGHDNLTAAEVAQLTGLSVHTLSYWRQSGRGPKTIRAGTRTLYRRVDVEEWLAEVDGGAQPVRSRKNERSESTSTLRWYEQAVEAAGRIEPAHTAPWKLASVYALLSIAESLLAQRQPIPPRPVSTGPARQQHGELLTVAEVAAMTRLSEGTLRYWRYAGSGGPESIKLGRRVMYRRADVEKWLQEAK